MLYAFSAPAAGLFVALVVALLAVAFFLGRRRPTTGGVSWFVDGLAFGGDVVSAAFLLGICGAVAFSGYDGFLYALGSFAGLVVALFVFAEPLRRRGTLTLGDALAAGFGERRGGVRRAAALSVLVVAMAFVVPEMVGAGAVLKPLLGFPVTVGIIGGGVVVMIIVVTMRVVAAPGTQFLRTGLLVCGCVLIGILVLQRGLTAKPAESAPRTLSSADFNSQLASNDSVLRNSGPWAKLHYARVRHADGSLSVWKFTGMARLQLSWPAATFTQCQLLTETPTGERLVNGLPQSTSNDLHGSGFVQRLPDSQARTGPLGPLGFLSAVEKSDIGLTSSERVTDDSGTNTIYSAAITSGADVLAAGNDPALFPGIRSNRTPDRLNFVSLMLALLFGAAALPHVFTRSSAAKDPRWSKSGMLGIAAVGLLALLTLYLGLGAMTSTSLDPTDSNIAALLLARSFGTLLFAFFGAIVFAAILSTASALVLAASGALAHALLKKAPEDEAQARTTHIVAVVLTGLAIVLGILFQKMNIAFLIAWAFNIAASANLPALTMVLFWKRTTRQGIVASILVGLVSAVTWILLSPDAYANLYHLPAGHSPIPFNQPALITLPLAYLAGVIVSLATKGSPEPGAA